MSVGLWLLKLLSSNYHCHSLEKGYKPKLFPLVLHSFFQSKVDSIDNKTPASAVNKVKILVKIQKSKIPVWETM